MDTKINLMVPGMIILCLISLVNPTMGFMIYASTPILWYSLRGVMSLMWRKGLLTVKAD